MSPRTAQFCITRIISSSENKQITADFIQDLFEVEYSLPGSNKRSKEEVIVMNCLSYLKDLEGM